MMPRDIRTCVPLLILAVASSTGNAQSTKLESRSRTQESSESESVQLSFVFERAPWRDVIKWISDSCDLALQYEDLPTGSFSYSDSRSFSQQEAIDRINLFLLPQGYTLIQSGRLLSVINLGDPRSMKQLDALASIVQAEDLDALNSNDLNSNDVVKCIFRLGPFKAADAVQELSVLNLLQPPSVFSKTNQLMITDTVAKLRNVKSILDAFESSTLGNGTVMKTFALKHVDAEDILLVARPHLGLATGEMIGIDVSLSADLQGDHIFVTGVEDKVKLIEALVESLDQAAEKNLLSDGAQAELRSHLVEGGNVQTVYSVLQTLLAGKSLRLSMDEAASSIVALATADVQREIEQTVAQLQAGGEAFEVIPLKTVDPYLAISLLEEMLELTDFLDEDERSQTSRPKLDADPGNKRLYVRAKPHQIEQIKQIVAGIDESTGQADSDLRILPISGKQAEMLLQTAARFWRRDNPILWFPTPSDAKTEDTERVINDRIANSRRIKNKLIGFAAGDSTDEAARYLTDNLRSQATPIRCQLTPRGLLLQSDDADALDALEESLRAIGGELNANASPPIIFYLKFTKPDDALRMLAELLDGGESARLSEAGTLVNGYVSSGSYLGSIVTSRDGTMNMNAGSMSVLADTRLNRLIAQGTTGDIQTIEAYLEIIDKDRSLTSVETYGQARVIELLHTRASEVANTIREAYSGRVAASASRPTGSAGGAAPGADNQASREAPAKEQADPEKSEDGSKKSSAKPTPNQPMRDREPKMTIAIHEPSNSLIVTAPEQLFQEVEQLVRLIDSRSEESMEIVSAANGGLLQAILQPGSRSGASGTRTSKPPAASSSSSTRGPERPGLSELLRERFSK